MAKARARRPASPPPSPNDLPLEIRKFIERATRPPYLAADGRLIGRPPVSAMFQGRRFFAVGKRMGFLSPNTTFHDFMVSLLLETVGRDWATEQRRTGLHPIGRWLDSAAAARGDTPISVDGTVAALPATGNVMALLTLAHDIYSVLHCAALPTWLVRRVRHPDQFQGARYEIAVAALFARAGFTIEWIADASRKRPEFTATHTSTGNRVAVEAKSRHRPGVLSRPGTAETDAVRADLDGLLNSALAKETDGLPYAVYLDANLPLAAPNATPRSWVGEVQEMLDAHDTPYVPARFSAVTVTNFSWHYHAEAPASLAAESLLFLPRNPKVPLRDQQVFRLLFKAATEHETLPADWETD